MSSCQLLAVAMLAVAPLLHNQLYSFPFLWLPPSPAPHSLSLTFPLYRFPLHQRLFSRSYTIRDCAMPHYLLANKNKTLFPFLCQLCDGREMGSGGSETFAASWPAGLPCVDAEKVEMSAVAVFRALNTILDVSLTTHTQLYKEIFLSEHNPFPDNIVLWRN